jgi:hypothetical protein
VMRPPYWMTDTMYRTVSHVGWRALRWGGGALGAHRAERCVY